MNVYSVNRWALSISLVGLLSFGSSGAFAKVSEHATPPGDKDVVKVVPEDQPDEPKPKLQVSGIVAVGTDFKSRGLSFTAGGTSVVGMVNLAYDGFYLNTIGMNADFGTVVDTDGNSQDLVNSSLIMALGYKKKWGGVELDAGATYYAFPGAFDNDEFVVHGPILGLPIDIPLGESNFFELHLGIGGSPWKYMQATFTVNWTPDYIYETGDNWAFEGNLKQVLWHGTNITLMGVGQLGYNVGDLLDYWYYNIGLTMVYKNGYVIDVRYNDTFSFNLDCSTTKLCGGAVLLRGGVLF